MYFLFVIPFYRLPSTILPHPSNRDASQFKIEYRDGRHVYLEYWRTAMVSTEYIADNTLLIQVDGQIDRALVNEIGLLVFRSFRMGMRVFMLNMKRISQYDEQTIAGLALIGKGLRRKGGTWRILWPPFSTWDRLLIRYTLQQLPPATWN